MLAHWYNSSWGDKSFHSDTLSWFQANQFLLLNVEWWSEKQKLPKFQSLISLTSSLLFFYDSPHANRYTNRSVFLFGSWRFHSWHNGLYTVVNYNSWTFCFQYILYALAAIDQFCTHHLCSWCLGLAIFNKKIKMNALRFLLSIHLYVLAEC